MSQRNGLDNNELIGVDFNIRRYVVPVPQVLLLGKLVWGLLASILLKQTHWLVSTLHYILCLFLDIMANSKTLFLERKKENGLL